MKKPIVKVILEIIMFMVGITILIRVDYRIAVGVFLLWWAHNIDQSIARQNHFESHDRIRELKHVDKVTK